MNIKDFSHLESDKKIKFKTENVLGEDITIVSYMIGDNELWEKALATECRGISFNSNGEVISRPFHKFFNVNENQHTQLDQIKDIDFEVLEKRDGSMVVPVLVNDTVIFKTKKSFFSDVANEANMLVSGDIVQFSKACLELDVTPIFEYTSPTSRIVIDYGNNAEFVLLSMRKFDGTYVEYSLMEDIAKTWNIPYIKQYDLSINDCIEKAKTLENFEGWVLRDTKTGFHVKLKTDWYLRNHRVRTQLRERDIADMIIAETIDDLKSVLVEENYDLDIVEKLEHKIAEELSSLVEQVEAIYNSIEDKNDFKSIALKYKQHPLFTIIMSLCRGKDFDYKKYWKNNYRQNYSLNCVYTNFGNKNE